MNNFVHLHTHSNFSMLDGVNSPKDLLERAKELGQNKLAFTEHGNLGSVVEIHKYARQLGVDYIIGMEAYICEDYENKDAFARRATLLVKDEEGWLNLLRLNYESYVKGFYYTARISVEDLLKYNKGLILLSGNYRTFLKLYQGKEYEEHNFPINMDLLKRVVDVYGEDFYYEINPLKIMYNDLNIQDHHNKKLFEAFVSLQAGGIVLTCDVHYANKNGSIVQERSKNLEFIQRRNNPEFRNIDSYDRYLCSREEVIVDLKNNTPETYEILNASSLLNFCLDNTVKISDQCDFNLDLSKQYPPTFDIKTHKDWEVIDNSCNPKDNMEYFIALVYGRAKGKLGIITKEYMDRLEYELSLMVELKVYDYFLIVDDLFNYANEQGYMYCARGSVNGSLVAYVMGLSFIDPIKHKIIFERFLSPSRKDSIATDQLLDIDCDFEAGFRQKAIEYLKQKYGESRICNVGTYSRYQPRMALKDAARVQQLYHKTALNNRALLTEEDIAKHEEGNRSFSFKRINELTVRGYAFGEMQDLFEDSEDFDIDKINDPKIREFCLDKSEWVDEHVKPMLGNVRAMGIHAAAVVLLPDDMWRLIPIRTQMAPDKKTRIIVTQWENSHTYEEYLNMCGFMALDILGVKHLSIIHNIIRDIKEIYNIDIKLSDIPLDDVLVYRSIANGENQGLFQLNKPRMRNLLRQVAPDCFQDIVAMNALNRPGPMLDKIPERYADIKHKRMIPESIHPIVEEILSDSYSLPIYSDHVMLLAHKVGGLTMADADEMRSAMKAKSHERFSRYQKLFIEGCQKFITKEKAEELWNSLSGFSQYGFPKAHATIYAFWGYMGQYFKIYHSVIYFCNWLKYANHDEYKEVIDIAHQYKVKIKSVDINDSRLEFDYHNNETIQWPFIAIKGLGEKAALAIVNQQPYISLEDFYKRVEKRQANKRIVVNLIIAGAFDNIEKGKSKQELLKKYFELKKERISNEMYNITNAELYSKKVELYGFTWNALFYEMEGKLKFDVEDYKQFYRADEDESVCTCGILINYDRKKTKKGSDYISIRILDIMGRIDVVLWEKALEQHSEILKDIKPGIVVDVCGRKQKNWNKNYRVSLSGFKGHEYFNFIK